MKRSSSFILTVSDSTRLRTSHRYQPLHLAIFLRYTAIRKQKLSNSYSDDSFRNQKPYTTYEVYTLSEAVLAILRVSPRIPQLYIHTPHIKLRFSNAWWGKVAQPSTPAFTRAALDLEYIVLFS